ncbi:MAG: tRNA dihydrouridine synthase DusB [Microthrixaceae bacterium]
MALASIYRCWQPLAVTELRFGSLKVDPPVVLAPMAGVTDAPFRVLCGSFGGGLFVNQMITARALVEGHRTSWELARFHPGERVRSLQLYGTEPRYVSEAVSRLVGGGLVDHLDLNFGCPAPKVTRNGGGAALPYKRRLLESVIIAAVQAAERESAGMVPVTVKLRMGIDDDHLTYLDAGRIAESSGAAAVALHARTALDHYGPPARWEAVATLKAEVTSIPVLGNGDVFCAADALALMERTGCDGVVIGRGALGRPWLFAELEAALRGEPVPEPPTLGEVGEVIRRHAHLLVEWYGEHHRFTAFRKHLSWYLKGYPVGPELRRQASGIETVSDVEYLLSRLDRDAPAPEGAAGFNRSHSNPLKRVALPQGWLEDPDELSLVGEAVAVPSGG